MASFSEMTRKPRAVNLKPTLDIHIISLCKILGRKDLVVKAGVNKYYHVQHVHDIYELADILVRIFQPRVQLHCCCQLSLCLHFIQKNK